jgi:hypothetical protein
MIARTKHQMRAYAAAGIAATSVFVVLYQVFRWLFIRYWEWQHDGRRMKFTFWADERALLLALLVGVLAFYLTLPMILSAVQRLRTNAKASKNAVWHACRKLTLKRRCRARTEFLRTTGRRSGAKRRAVLISHPPNEHGDDHDADRGLKD